MLQLMQLTKDERSDIADAAFEAAPVGISGFDLYWRLNELSHEEGDQEWPVGLSPVRSEGLWAVVLDPGDPRLPADWTGWDDRVIGWGETIAKAIEQAEAWLSAHA